MGYDIESHGAFPPCSVPMEDQETTGNRSIFNGSSMVTMAREVVGTPFSGWDPGDPGDLSRNFWGLLKIGGSAPWR